MKYTIILKDKISTEWINHFWKEDIEDPFLWCFERYKEGYHFDLRRDKKEIWLYGRSYTRWKERRHETEESTE